MGPESLPVMHAILAVAAVGLVAALLALGHELGLGVFSPLVPVLVVLVPKGSPLGREMSHDLTHYTAENVGRMVAFCAVLIGIYALRTQARRAPAVIAGALLAAAGLTHGIPTLVAGAMLGLYGLGALVLDRKRLRGLAVRGAVVAAVFGVTYVGVVGLSGGTLGFEGAGRGSLSGFPPNVDPTRSFSRGKLVRPVRRHGHFLIPPRQLLRSYADKTANLPGGARAAVGALAVLFAATVVLVWRNRALLPLGVLAWGLVVAFVGAAFFFSYRYRTQIPGVFGVWRLYDYGVLVPALVLPALLAEGAKPLRATDWLGVAVLAVPVAAVGLIAALVVLRQHDPTRRGVLGLGVIARVASTVPCDARMLANARTAGTWEATTGRRGVTEGRAPYLQAGVLSRVLKVLVGANSFFADPGANRDFLTRERVDYVVVVKPGIWFGYGGTGRAPEPDDADAVAALPGVRTAFRNSRVAIFEVGSRRAATDERPPRWCPV
jgi:hypothetical protein